MQRLLFLPGTLCTETTFAHQKEYLQDVAEVHVIPLARGHSITASAQWILGQRTLGEVREPFVLVGFSQGAIVALEIMRLAPERVTKLCLISANPKAPTTQQLETWNKWQQDVQAGHFEHIIQGFASNVHPDKRSDPKLRETILNMARETGSETFITQLQALATRIDSRPYLKDIDCPTLLITGRQDTLTPLEYATEIQSLIPKSVLVPTEDCGHYVTLEQPQAVTALLRLWLESSL